MTDSTTPFLTLVSAVPQQWVGGAGIIMVNGTIGGATVDLYISDDGTNWIAIGSQLSATGIQVFAGPANSWLKAVVAGGVPNLTIKVYREAGLNAWIVNPSSGSSGGPTSGVTIDGLNYKGQKTSALSFPVVLASDYAISTSVADMLEITGTISSAAVLSNFPKTDCTGYRSVAVQFTTVTSGNSGVVEESNDGTIWTTLTSIGGSVSVTAAGLHVYNFSGKQVRVRCSVYASGSVAVTAEFRSSPAVFPQAYGSGVIDTRTVRMVLASDGTLPAFASTPTVNLGTLNGAALEAGNLATIAGAVTSSKVQTNVAQINGVTPLMGTGNTGTGSPRCTIATDQAAIALWGHGVTAAAVPANAQYKGLLGKTALPTAVSDGQLVGAMADKFGRQIVRSAPRDLLAIINTNSGGGTSGTLLAAQGANVFADIARLLISNTSATDVLVSILDGTNTYPIEVKAGAVVGWAGPGDIAQPAASANTAWTYTVSSGVSTIYFVGLAVLNK